MSGDIGFYNIKPDQVQVLSSLLVLIFIPLYEVAFYPLLSLVGIRRPLQKMALGGIFAGVAFLCSMGVEIVLEPTYPVLPKPGEAQIRIFNGVDCRYNLISGLSPDPEIIEPYSYFADLNIGLKNEIDFASYIMSSESLNCGGQIKGIFHLKSNTATSHFIRGTPSAPKMDIYEDDPEKSRQGTPLIRVLDNTFSNVNIVFKDEKGNEQYNELVSLTRNLTDIQADVYEIFVGGKSVLGGISLKHGGVHTVVVNEPVAGSYVS